MRDSAVKPLHAREAVIARLLREAWADIEHGRIAPLGLLNRLLAENGAAQLYH